MRIDNLTLSTVDELVVMQLATACVRLFITTPPPHRHTCFTTLAPRYTHPPIRSFIGPPAPGGYRDGNFVFELCATECLVEMQILIQEFADIKSEAHESYEVRVSYMAME